MAVIVTVTQVCAGPAELDIKLNLPSDTLYLNPILKKRYLWYTFGNYFKANIYRLRDSASWMCSLQKTPISPSKLISDLAIHDNMKLLQIDDVIAFVPGKVF